MKYLLLLVLATISTFGYGQEQSAPLFVVHFSTGPAWDSSLPAGQQRNFSEHSANLNRLRGNGVIRFGARYGDFGMIVIAAQSLEAARELIADDPGVKADIFVFQVEPLNVFYPWRDGEMTAID